ncbi:uncharacterized protein BJ212DRAFT_1407442 [Suillus subaureus]|uniref:Uncharacterized protein n=1 Tax=Suillus subaureus TaxID=48587 RepID=A0A9P7DK63_9AGAM|nr:uncharacterized protein BJ212DRAFT_1407442 [Suillus subaureus]KAG1796848.1 hypothetical protein BJ212DRAFT_1407442 [Suillus subaureus]
MMHPPYSSDARSASPSMTTIRVKRRIEPLQRETHVLNLFIALKISDYDMFSPLHTL